MTSGSLLAAAGTGTESESESESEYEYFCREWHWFSGSVVEGGQLMVQIGVRVVEELMVD